MLGLAALIFGGRFEQYPDLEVLAATSGGALALVIDRLDTAYAPTHWERGPSRPPGAPDRRPPALRYENRITRPPSAYLRQIYVDTTSASDLNQLANLEAFGADRMMFGTDSPPLDTPLAAALDAVQRLPITDDQQANILGGNAARLFKLDEGR